MSSLLYVLPLRAVAVHAAIRRLSAGLSVHGRSSPRILHGHACLHTPLDAAAGLTRLLTSRRFCGKNRKRIINKLDFAKSHLSEIVFSYQASHARNEDTQNKIPEHRFQVTGGLAEAIRHEFQVSSLKSLLTEVVQIIPCKFLFHSDLSNIQNIFR